MAMFRGEWRRCLRDDLDTRLVAASKGSQGAILRLAEEYGLIPVDSRQQVDDALLEWLVSEDEGLRYDALYIVSEYRVRRAEACPLISPELLGEGR